MTITTAEKETLYEPAPGSGEGAYVVLHRASFYNNPGLALVTPVAVPRDQLYYWSTAWQREEAIARDELARGQSVVFKDADELIDWLRDP